MKYFSMFTGIGGFELGINQAWRNSFYCQEEETQNSEGNKSISKTIQRNKDNITDCNKDKSAKDTGRTLFQNRQVKGDSIPRELEETETDPKTSKQMGQGSNRDISERDGIPDDKKILFNRRSKPNSIWDEQPVCVGYSEIDKFSIQTYEKHFGGVKNYGDATKINPEELPDFDFLCGGFPCQAFSIAGKRRGFSDTRGTLFFDIARILKVKRPKFILLENVKGLLNHEGGKTFSVIIQALEELGYRTQWMVLNSKFFGVPQNRERVFIIGCLGGPGRPEILPFGYDAAEIPGTFEKEKIIYKFHRANEIREYKDECCCLTESRDHKGGANVPCLTSTMGTGGHNVPMVMDYRGDEGFRKYKNNISPSLRKDGLDYCQSPIVAKCVALRGRKNGQEFESQRNNTNSITSVQKDNYIATNLLRRLTPIECERLQGYPDNWTRGVSDTQRYKQLGNAVTVNVIEAIVRKYFQS